MVPTDTRVSINIVTPTDVRADVDDNYFELQSHGLIEP